MASKILIVDDDTEIRRLLDEEVRDLGHEAIHAADSIQALASVRRERPDLILLDLSLPGGDGYSVLERLQRLPESSIPVIVFSGSRSPQAEQRALQLGAREYVQKSFSSNDLVAAIERALTPRRTAGLESGGEAKVTVLPELPSLRLSPSRDDVSVQPDA